MVYDRNTRGTNPGDYYNNQGMDYGRDYGSGRDSTSSSARDYAAAGEYDRDDDRSRSNRGQYGQYGQRDGNRDSYGRDSYGRDSYGRDGGWGNQDYGNSGYSQRGGRGNYGGQYGQSRGNDDYRGGYGQSSNDGYGSQRYGQNFGGQSYGNQGYGSQDFGNRGYGNRNFGGGRDWNNDRGNRGRFGQGGQNRDYGRQPQGYDYEDRGFFQRAGDEVRSWFGDDEAERRRDMDARYDEQRYNNDRDRDYHSWRQGEVSKLDRDYDEYRQENRTKFENEFSSWRTNRQGQRDLLTKVDDHMDVVGSDGSHVGTVDKVRGDRIILTKNDADAGGRHHSIPSSWLKEVDTKVTLSKTADEAKKQWRDEERNQAMFGDKDETSRSTSNYGSTGTTGSYGSTGSTSTTSSSTTGTTESTATGTGDDKTLNKSFSGTY